MKLDSTQANYNLAIHKLGVMLHADSKIGSEEDIEIMQLSRFVEDYEMSRVGKTFEPYYVTEKQ